MPVTPIEQEEEYFARQEFERRKKVLIEQESRGNEGERERILAVGLWFDCGELDQVLGREDGFLSGLTRIFA